MVNTAHVYQGRKVLAAAEPEHKIVPRTADHGKDGNFKVPDIDIAVKPSVKSGNRVLTGHGLKPCDRN